MARIGFSVAAGIRRWTLNKLLKGAGLGAAPTEIDVPAAGGDAVITIAADDTPAAQKDRADFVCSGANDEVTIQALVAAGVTVKLMVGTYEFNAALAIGVSNFALEGSGPGTLIQGTNAEDYIIITNDSADIINVRIWNLKMDGTDQSNYKALIHIYANNQKVEEVAIEHCVLTLAEKQAIYVHESGSGAVEFTIINDNHFFDNTDYDISTLGHAERGVICGNLFRSAGAVSLYFATGSSHWVISDNSFEGVSGYAIHDLGGSKAYTGNTIQACRAGIKIQDGDVTISGNVIMDCSYYAAGNYAIYIMAAAIPSVTIVGNDLVANKGTTIMVEADGVSIIGNMFFNNCNQADNTYDEIQLTADSINAIVALNNQSSTAGNTPRYFVNEIAGTAGNIISQNKVINVNAVSSITSELTTGELSPEDYITNQRQVVTMINNTGGALVAGDVVSFAAVAAGNEIATPVAIGEDLVFGMLAENIANGASGYIKMIGKTTILKATNVGGGAIGIGDFLVTEVGNRARKGATGHMAFAIALEAGDAADLVLDALLIVPRKLS